MSKLPQRYVVVRVDFGSGPRHPAISYTAPVEVIVRFATALRQWNPDYHLHVERVTDDKNPPPFPTWRLYAWDETAQPNNN